MTTTRKFFTAYVVLFLAAFFVTVGLIRAADAATDYGPPPGPGRVTCQDYGIDPPGGYQVTVHAESDVDGVTGSEDVVYGSTEQGFAVFAWNEEQHVKLLEPGPHHLSASFTWNIGTGATVLTADVTCVEPPPSTTTTTTQPSTTTSTVKPATPPPPAAPQTPPGGQLPHTGSNSTDLLLAAGVVLVASGGAAARRYRQVTR